MHPPLDYKSNDELSIDFFQRLRNHLLELNYRSVIYTNQKLDYPISFHVLVLELLREDNIGWPV